MGYDREHLLRYLDGELSPEEERELSARLGRDAALRDALDDVRALRGAMTAGAAGSFALGFSERVIRRLATASNGDDALYRALSWFFRRAAIASAVVALLFGTLNAIEYGGVDLSATVLESIFGLPTVTLADALAFEPV